MTPNSIKALLAIRGLDYESVLKRMKAKGVKSDKFELSKLISGSLTSKRKQEAFAAALGMKRDEVFDAEFDSVVAYRKSA